MLQDGFNKRHGNAEAIQNRWATLRLNSVLRTKFSVLQLVLLSWLKRDSLEEHCGDVLGMLAYARPFFDGNGRTLLPILTELLRRLGLKMDWSLLDRESYLTALAEEICTSWKGVLNAIQHPHISRTH